MTLEKISLEKWKKMENINTRKSVTAEKCSKISILTENLHTFEKVNCLKNVKKSNIVGKPRKISTLGIVKQSENCRQFQHHWKILTLGKVNLCENVKIANIIGKY